MASALVRTKSIDRLLAEHDSGEITLKRSLGAMALGIPYIGIDTNVDLRPVYERMIRELSGPNANVHVDVAMRFQDASTVDFSKFRYDMVFTSPTYFQTVSRLLKPGGTLGLVEHRSSRLSEISSRAGEGYLDEYYVIAVAQQAGFYDQAHMHQHFVRITGQTPGQYKKRKMSQLSNSAG